MKKRFSAIQVFLAIAISLFILTFPAYRRFNKLSHTKFVRTVLSFEHPGQKEESSKENKESKGLGPTAFFTLFLPGINLLDRFSRLFCLPISLYQETLILRCWEDTLLRFLFLILSSSMHSIESSGLVRCQNWSLQGRRLTTTEFIVVWELRANRKCWLG